MKIDEMIKGYTLPNGEVFTQKMVFDLLMWKNFAEDYGYDKTGIKKLREDIENYRQLKTTK